MVLRNALQVALVVLLSNMADAVYPDVHHFNIYSGEQLDDTIMPTDQNGMSFVHAVLVVHQTVCTPLVDQYELKPHYLPMSKNVMLLFHDYELSNSRIWYDFNGGDLRRRFNISSCFDVLFLPRGRFDQLPAVRWDPDGDLKFTDWVWKQIEVVITVHNQLDIRVSVEVLQTGHTKGPKEYAHFDLSPGSQRAVIVYESSLVHVYHEQIDLQKREVLAKHIGAWIINGTMRIDISTQPSDDIFSAVYDQVQRVTKKEDFQAIESAWNIMQGHLLNIKQPLCVPQFTETGYKKMKMPAGWFKILENFYHSNIQNRVDEGWTYGNSIINQNEVQCSMVWLSEAIRQQVAEGMKQLFETWAGCELEMSAFYGVREYFGGNILRNHVDRLDTHVISAIIVIDKDLGDAEDWLLEVIEYHGNRSTIALEPGDMLLYESARLVHGRPKPFRGKKYANVFLHYRPKHGWKDHYVHDAEGFTLYFPDNKSEPLMPLNSDLTTKYGYRRKMVPVSESHQVEDGFGAPGLRKDYYQKDVPKGAIKVEL